MHPSCHAARKVVTILMAILIATAPCWSTTDASLDYHLKQLGSDEFHYYYDSMKALAQMADPAVTGALIGLLKSEVPEVRERAVDVLGQRHDPSALDALVAALDDENEAVRTKAAAALASFKDPKAVSALVLHLGDGEAVSEALGAIGSPAVEPVLSVLKSNNTRVRLGAVNAILCILYNGPDPRVVEPLIALLKDKNPDISSSAARALAHTADSRAFGPFIAILNNKASNARGWAPFALGQIGDRRAVKPLIAVLKENDSGLRREAAEALGHLKDSSAADALFALCNDRSRDGEVAKTAGIALARLGDPRAVTVLLSAAGEDIDEESTHALRFLGSKAIGPLITAYPTIATTAVRSVVQAIVAESGDPRAVGILVSGLRDPDRGVQYYAMQGIESISDKSVRESLIPLLHDKNPNVRTAIILMLAKADDPRATEALVSLISEQPTKTPEQTMRLLSITGGPQALDTARGLLKSQNAATRKTALRIAMAVGDTAGMDVVLSAMNDPDADIQISAIEAAESLGDKSAVPALTALLKHKMPGIRLRAAESLAVFADPRAEEPLLDTLRDPDPHVRASACFALGFYKDPKLVEPLAAMLSENDWDRRMADYVGLLLTMEGTRTQIPQIRENAAKSLGIIGPPAVNALIESTKSADPVTKWLALSVLGRTGDARVVPILIAALKDKTEPKPYPEAENALKRQIAKISDPEERRIVEENSKLMSATPAEALDGEEKPESPYILSDALTELDGPGVADALVPYMKDKDETVRMTVIQVLVAKNDSRVIDSLVQLLDSPALKTRRLGAKLLAAMKEPRAVDISIGNLRHKDPDIRLATFQCLRESRDPRVADGVFSLMSDPAVSSLKTEDDGLTVSYAAAVTLAKLGDSRAVAVLLRMMKETRNTDHGVAYSSLASGALLDLRQIVDTKPLVAALKDDEPLVKLMAVALLVRAGSSTLGDLLVTAEPILLRHGEEPELWDSTTEIKGCAAKALAYTGNCLAADLLLRVVREGDEVARWHAASALGDMKDSRIVEFLVRHAGVYDTNCSTAVEALGKIGDRRAVWPIIYCLAGATDITDRKRIATSLSDLTGQRFGSNARAWAQWWRAQKSRQ